MLAGGQLFGFLGILVALPVAAVAMVLLRHAHERYLASGLYGAGPPVGAASAATAVRSDGPGELANPRIAAEAAPTGQACVVAC